MPSTRSAPQKSTVSTALARNRMGVPGVSLAIASSVAPLTVVAGVVATGVAVTGLTGISIALIAVAVIYILFAVGYVAMARHITNAGAFYAYIARGLGRPAGVGASWVALLAYNSFQIAAYGGFGFLGVPLIEQWFGVKIAWWVLALAAWVVVALLGVRDVGVSAKVLGVLVIAETLVVLVYSVVIALSAGFSPSMAPLSLSSLAGPGAGALIVIAATGFAGVEQGAVYIEESRDPQRTVARATYFTIAFITAVYAFASWVQISAAGADVVERAGAEGPDMFFNLAATSLGDNAVQVGRLMFVTSMFAAMVAFHNIIARYTFALGREGVFPRFFSRTVAGAPRNSSLAQSLLALVVLGLYAVAGWDPLVKLFFWGGSAGGLGVLLLITLTSAAVVAYFARNPHGEKTWTRLGAPALATLLLLVISYLALTNLTTLFGDPTPAWVVPTAFAVALAAGAAWGVVLRGTRPTVYDGIGLGARSAGAATTGFAAALNDPTADAEKVNAR